MVCYSYKQKNYQQRETRCMSEKQQPGSPASDKIADLEALGLQASNINGNISPASSVIADSDDDETTVKRAIIQRHTRRDEVASSGSSLPDKYAADKTQESSDASDQGVPFVEQLEFPLRKQPF